MSTEQATAKPDREAVPIASIFDRLPFKVSNQVHVDIKAATRDVDGKEVEFAFAIKCDRLTGEQIAAYNTAIRNALVTSGSAAPAVDAIVTHTRNWLVTDKEGNSIPYSSDALTELLVAIEGLPHMAWRRLQSATLAIEKN